MFRIKITSHTPTHFRKTLPSSNPSAAEEGERRSPGSAASRRERPADPGRGPSAPRSPGLTDRLRQWLQKSAQRLQKRDAYTTQHCHPGPAVSPPTGPGPTGHSDGIIPGPQVLRPSPQAGRPECGRVFPTLRGPSFQAALTPQTPTTRQGSRDTPEHGRTSGASGGVTGTAPATPVIRLVWDTGHG